MKDEKNEGFVKVVLGGSTERNGSLSGEMPLID